MFVSLLVLLLLRENQAELYPVKYHLAWSFLILEFVAGSGIDFYGGEMRIFFHRGQRTNVDEFLVGFASRSSFLREYIRQMCIISSEISLNFGVEVLEISVKGSGIFMVT